MSVVFREGALYDTEAGPATFVATAYAATTRRRLHAGRHTLTIEFVRADGTSSLSRRTLDVVHVTTTTGRVAERGLSNGP